MKIQLPPRVYVVEGNGQALVAFEAFSRNEASELPREKWFRDELASLRSESRKLWNGQDPLAVRRAEENEIAEFNDAKSVAGHKEADEIFLAYLVALDGSA